MNARAERLNYIAKELQIIRHDLAQLAGSDQVAEVRMERSSTAMIHLATTCAEGHVEFVPAIGRRDSAPYFGAVFCRRVIEGEFCRAEIENTQVLCEEHGLVGSEVCPCFADLEPVPLQAMECGITEPHAPGAHPPPIDLEPAEEEKPAKEEPDEEEPVEEQGCWHYDYTRFCTQCDPASHEPEDEHEADTCPTCGELDAPAPRLRWLARLPSKISVGLLITLGLLDLVASIYLALKGHWLLALLG